MTVRSLRLSLAFATLALALPFGAPAAQYNQRLGNLSTRAQVGTGANVMIAGFVVQEGAPKRVLIRAVGARLASAPFNLTGVLADPQLQLFNAQGTLVLANDNWSTDDAATMNAVGAFALVNGSADAALVVDLPAGQYSAFAGGANNGTGVALVELYDVTGGTDSRLANIATRGYVGTGGDVLISGFVVSSEGSKTLLIRAVGPTLAGFGVGGALADPVLTVYGRAAGATADSALLTNNDWGTNAGAANTAAVAAQVGAFALANGSKDAAVVVTLPPGAYTVQASGAGNTTGTALVEIYVVP